VYETPERPLPTHVLAGTALLRAGLERAARIAGLTPVGPSERAVIVLRCEDDAENDAPIDIRAGLDGVTVTIARDPDPETWTALRALAGELLGGAGERG
jgi:hypothetical protein